MGALKLGFLKTLLISPLRLIDKSSRPLALICHLTKKNNNWNVTIFTKYFNVTCLHIIIFALTPYKNLTPTSAHTYNILSNNHHKKAISFWPLEGVVSIMHRHHMVSWGAYNIQPPHCFLMLLPKTKQMSFDAEFFFCLVLVWKSYVVFK